MIDHRGKKTTKYQILTSNGIFKSKNPKLFIFFFPKNAVIDGSNRAFA